MTQVMQSPQADPVVFGSPTTGLSYTDRIAAYAVIVNREGMVAAVKSRKGYFLPGGGSLPGEVPEETVLREVREELGRSAQILGSLGKAIQYFSAEGKAFKMHTIFFSVDLADDPSDNGEHELYWLPIAEVDGAFFHRSHEWAIHRALEPSD